MRFLSRLFWCTAVLWTVTAGARAQDVADRETCAYRLTGCVLDFSGLKPIPYAEVWLKGTGKGTVADAEGNFTIKGLCKGRVTLVTHSLGYVTAETPVDITGHTSRLIHIHHTMQSLGTVSITSVTEKPAAYSQIQAVDVMQAEDLDRVRGLTLGESLKSIPGVYSVQSGPSISKPVIHGLYGNRILILNNGVRQEGQQWGGEHAPEVDPFIASRITVIKGAAAIRYGSDAVGGVILLEPKSPRDSAGIGGEINLAASSNGLSGTLSGMLEGAAGGKAEGLSWRVQGTLRKAGNTRTADYYMKNTGMQEGDFSAAAAYRRKNYGADVYYSQYNASIGIFTGSHVGNLKDLMLAFNSPRPLEESGFSYAIGRPRQVVNHRLLKAVAFAELKKAGRLELVYAYQVNRRREFQSDIPYSNDPAVVNAPQLDFRIATHTADLVFEHKRKAGFSGSAGINAITQGNVYRWLIPLIPNYRNYGIGVFWFERWTRGKVTVEAGVRYDYRRMQAYRLSMDGVSLHKPTFGYQNFTSTAGIRYAPSRHWSFNAHYGSAWRPPSVNELYINGIHQSAAAYELGDSTLKTERSHQFEVSAKYVNQRVSVEAGAYCNLMDGYIYARPTLTTVTLVSGTYPLFRYTQTNAVFTGADLRVKYSIYKGLEWISGTSLIWAYNRSARDYLVLTPTHRLENTLRYTWKQAGRLKGVYVGVTNVSVPRQKRVPANSDYVAPPAGYTLFHLDFGGTVPLGKRELALNCSLYNFTNRAYRDYLNRFRYFADEPGVNLVLRAKFTF